MFVNTLLSKQTRPLSPAKEIQKMIILSRQVYGFALTRQAGNNPTMLLHKTRRFKRGSELLPLQRRIGYNPSLFVARERMHDGRQRADSFFHALIRRRQIESGVERLQMPAEFILQDLGWL